MAGIYQSCWYDANDNATRRSNGSQDITLTHDAENWLTAISGGVVTASYTYDGDGNRVKADFGAGSVTVYVGAYYEQTTSGASTTITKYYQAGGQRVALRVNGVLRWLAADHLGSTSITADGVSGARIAELRYKPWGETRYTWGATPTQRRFTGQVLDSVAGGLYFYNARYYDPSLGRFTQADTIVPEPGNPQALNRYSYVGNSPVSETDPDGHCWPVCTALIGGAIGAGIGATSVALPQMIRNVRGGQPLTANIDPAEVGKAAAVGFVSGAISGATAGVGTGLAATIGVGAVSNVLAGQTAIATDNVLSGRAITTGMGDVGDMAKDALLGGVIGGVGHGATKILERVSVRNVSSSSQSVIDEIVENELGNVKLTHYPIYDANMPPDTYGIATRGTSTRIGPLALEEGRRETLITIVHEGMHHRLWARGWPQSEAYVERVAQRFAQIRGQ